MLTTPQIYHRTNQIFRQLLEKGRIIIYGKTKIVYVTYIPVISFLLPLEMFPFREKADISYKNCDAANNLLCDLMETEVTLKPGTWWWERIVCFTIARKHIDESDGKSYLD